MSMEKISTAILDKVRAEAQDIIKEAEEKARERVEKAKKQQAAELEKKKGNLIGEANEEANRILARASITARQELLIARTRIIDEIIGRVKETLSAISGGDSSFLALIKEAVDTLNVDKVRIYVSPKDASTVKKIVAKDKRLAKMITEIKEIDCTGGVAVEDTNGRIRIDNTYDTRLEMLLPKLLPEIGKELFQNL